MHPITVLSVPIFLAFVPAPSVAQTSPAVVIDAARVGSEKLAFDETFSELKTRLEMGSGKGCGIFTNEDEFDFTHDLKTLIKGTVAALPDTAPDNLTYEFGIYEFDIDPLVRSRDTLFKKKFFSDVSMQLTLRLTVRDQSKIVFQDLVGGKARHKDQDSFTLIATENICKKLVNGSGKLMIEQIYREIEPRITLAMSNPDDKT